MDVQTQSCIDQLLLDQGELTPLDFLLAQGHLQYGDYEAWRQGATTPLAQHLFGDTAQIVRSLRDLADYARSLGLAPEPVCYTPWGGGQPLTFSRDETLDRLFHQVYRKPADQPQLDLFMDSAGTSLANGIMLALTRRDVTEAGTLLGTLYRADPGHPHLGALERLVEAAHASETPAGDPRETLRELQEEILPLAEALLGRESRHFLVPLWRRLGAALKTHPFDPARPALHASYTASRALDWQAVLDSVEAEPDRRDQPILLRRHARACEHLRRAADALMDQFELCWRFPAQAIPAPADTGAEMTRAWQMFHNLEPELEVPVFPAWLLILRPALANWLPQPETKAPRDYRLVFALQRTGGDAVSLRAQVKALNPALFRHFIRAQGTLRLP